MASQVEESDLLLTLPPDRIGHGTFLHPEVGGSQSLVDKVLKNNIPLGETELEMKWLFCGLCTTLTVFLISPLVELCLTSNIKGQTVPFYSKHHFKYWYQLGHPSVICVSFIPLYTSVTLCGECEFNQTSLHHQHLLSSYKYWQNISQ